MKAPFWLLIMTSLFFALQNSPVVAQNSSDDLEQPTSSFGTSSEDSSSTEGTASKIAIGHGPIVGFGESDDALSAPGVLGTEGSGPIPIMLLEVLLEGPGDITLVWDGGSFTAFDIYRSQTPEDTHDPLNRILLGTTNTTEMDLDAHLFDLLFYLVKPAQ